MIIEPLGLRISESASSVSRSTHKKEASQLDIQGIVVELKKERDRLNNAIAALEGSSSKKLAGASAYHKKTSTNDHKGSRLSVEGRKRLSDLMKKRWAERRKKASEKRS